MKKSPLLVVAFALACATSKPPAPPPPPPPKPMLGSHGFELSSIDRSVGACDDFYQYAVGGWRNANPLPAIYPRYGRFEEVADRNRERLRDILESAAKDTGLSGFGVNTPRPRLMSVISISFSFGA